MAASGSIDDALRALPAILSELKELRRENAELKALFQGAQPEHVKKGYDVNDLKARGYGERMAYHILRTHGIKMHGRRYRITHEKLVELENENPVYN